jgi:glutathione S-transferase
MRKTPFTFTTLDGLIGHIAGRNWFALDRLTIAGMALGAIVKRCLEFPIERPTADRDREGWPRKPCPY